MGEREEEKATILHLIPPDPLSGWGLALLESLNLGVHNLPGILIPGICWRKGMQQPRSLTDLFMKTCRVGAVF